MGEQSASSCHVCYRHVCTEHIPCSVALQALKSYKLVMTVDPKHHPKIIGRRGAVISKIRDEFDVNIQFPDKGSEKDDEITVVGYEDKAKAAQDEILKLVAELVSQKSSSSDDRLCFDV